MAGYFKDRTRIAEQFVNRAYTMTINKDINTIVEGLNTAGVPINVQRLEEHITEYTKKETEATKAFKEMVAASGHNLNLSKRADLLKWFFEILALPVYKSGKTGPSLDAESLEFLAEKNISAQYYADAKKAHSMVTTLTNIKAAVREGRIYPQHNLNKAASGRFSSSGAGEDKLNINGWSKDIRDILEASEGTTLVSFDYRNMEGAVQYFLAQEEEAMKDYVEGTDMHQKLADTLGITRKQAKVVRHGIGYGMTAFGLGRRLGVSEEEAQEFIEKFWKQQPKVRALKQDIIHKARIFGEVSTISGFTRRIYGLSDDQIYSTFVQGSAADLFKQALVEVSKFLTENNLGRVVVPMHDCLVCEINTDMLTQTVGEVIHIMCSIHPKFNLMVEAQINKW